MNFTIMQGDNRHTLKTLEDNTVDAIITDPPYGIDFLGKAWDANTGALETYTECLRVLKPGGYILAFSAARTYHHLAITLEQAGFEIRDQLMWLYASGFPKAQDIGKAIDKRAGKGVEQTIRAETPEAKQWAGWKTALKPAHEPICMARKPFKSSTIDNVLTHGVGALNIDATRIGEVADRFPSNVIGLVEGYQKFFYCPKVSRKERHCGFKAPPAMFGGVQGCYDEHGQRYAVGLDSRTGDVGNNHPTVKPVELMKYLIKLVTPPNSTVLDPFTGSGSTGMAAVELGHTFIGCELDADYVDIAKRRITAWNTDNTQFGALFETE